jgi:proteasome alpha subunit
VLTQVFTHDIKPLEVEILVAEVGVAPEEDQLFRILFDGTPVDEDHFTVLGGEAEPITERVKEAYAPTMTLGDGLKGAVKALAGPDRTLVGSDLEVAVLARSNGRRAFRRIVGDELDSLLA